MMLLPKLRTLIKPPHGRIHRKFANATQKFNNKSGKLVPVNKDLTTKYIGNKTKQDSIALVDELILTSSLKEQSASTHSHDWLDNYGKNDWEYWKTYIQDKENTIWEATLNVATTANGEKILYDISPIKKMERSVKSDTISINNSIAKGKDSVNPLSENSSEKIKKVKERAALASKKEANPPTESKDIRFSLVDNYTQKQYNDFGWVRANNVISSAAWKNFDSKVSKKRFFPPKTENGEWIISVSDDSSENKGVENILVFAKGTYQNPKVSQIIKINYNDETRVDIIREAIYERQGIIRKSFINSVCAFYTREDFLRSTNGRKTSRQTISTNRPKTSGSGNVRSNQKNLNKKPIRYDFPDEGGMIVTYSDGTTEERSSLTYAPTGKTNIVMDNTLSRAERRRAQKAAKKYTHRFQSLRVAFVNQQAAIEDALKDMGRSLEEAEAVTQTARCASSKAQRAIGGDIVDTSEMHTSGDATTLAKGIQKVMAPVK